MEKDMEKGTLYVYVRDLKTNDVVHAFEYEGPLTYERLDRLVAGLMRVTDHNRYYVDAAAVTMAIQREHRVM